MNFATGVSLEAVSLSLGSHKVFSNLSLHLQGAQWHSILGRSGIGKSSLLKIIAGLQVPDSGRVKAISNPGSPSATLSPLVAYMAQDDGLLPWLSVRDNVQLGPRLRGEGVQDSRARADSLLNSMELSTWADALPAVLSGGMRQRVALARTLLEDRPIVLMDEPFSRLDAITRDELQTLAHQRLAGRTVVLITHDPMEALRLSNQIHILNTQLKNTVHTLYLTTPTPRPLNDAQVAHRLPQLWHYLKWQTSTRVCEQQNGSTPSSFADGNAANATPVENR